MSTASISMIRPFYFACGLWSVTLGNDPLQPCLFPGHNHPSDSERVGILADGVVSRVSSRLPDPDGPKRKEGMRDYLLVRAISMRSSRPSTQPAQSTELPPTHLRGAMRSNSIGDNPSHAAWQSPRLSRRGKIDFDSNVSADRPNAANGDMVAVRRTCVSAFVMFLRRLQQAYSVQVL